MSLQPQPLGPAPDETVRVAQAAFPHGNSYMRMRDALGTVYHDATFAKLFPRRGPPALAPWRLALVTVMQFAEGLSDRQAADAVRARIDWKYALGLELTDLGFNYSVLSAFRERLVTGGAEQVLLEALLTACRTAGLLRRRGRQRTDSTHVLGVIRGLNRLERVGRTLQQALNALAAVAPDWLRQQADPAWFERYGRQVEQGRLPQERSERQALPLLTTIGADGLRLLRAVYDRAAPTGLWELSAVQVLRQVWVQQDAVAEDQSGGWVVQPRRTAEAPPPALLIHSPYDPEARYGAKRQHRWVGYKVQLTESSDDDLPHLVTQVETTVATTADVAVTATVHAELADQDLLPQEHLVDTGYVSAELIVSSQRQYGVELVGSVRPDSSWQAKAGLGFALADFTVDWEHCTVTGPGGHTSSSWKPKPDPWGNAAIFVKFRAADWTPCLHRTQYTRSAQGPRMRTLRLVEQTQALQQVRAQQATPAFAERYAKRAGIEGTLSQGVRAFGLQRSRYVGLLKTRLDRIATAAAMNLQRLWAWWTNQPRAQTRHSALAALALGA